MELILSFCLHRWRLNSGCQTCRESALPAEPSHQPSFPHLFVGVYVWAREYEGSCEHMHGAGGGGQVVLRCYPHCLTQNFSLRLGLANENYPGHLASPEGSTYLHLLRAGISVCAATPGSVSISISSEQGFQWVLPPLGLFSQGSGELISGSHT